MEFPIWVKNSQCHWKQWNFMHSNAFGFGVEDSKVKDFILYCNTTLNGFSFSPCYFVDFIFDVNNTISSE